MKVDLMYEDDKVSIKTKDIIASGSNFMLFEFAKFLDDNAIKDTLYETERSNMRYITFEIKDELQMKCIRRLDYKNENS
jgi:hypothetical protein